MMVPMTTTIKKILGGEDNHCCHSKQGGGKTVTRKKNPKGKRREGSLLSNAKAYTQTVTGVW